MQAPAQGRDAIPVHHAQSRGLNHAPRSNPRKRLGEAPRSETFGRGDARLRAANDHYRSWFTSRSRFSHEISSSIWRRLCVVISIGYYARHRSAALRFAIRVSFAGPPVPKIARWCAILKALNGLTDNLRDKIVSYLELDYPSVEYYFGVSDSRDRAAEVPAVVAQLLSAKADHGDRRRRTRMLESQGRQVDRDGRKGS